MTAIHRGEIYWVDFDPTRGSEIKKTRPALVVSNDANNQASDLVSVLPLTSRVKTVWPFEVLIPAGEGGLKTASKAKANQIRTVDKKRLGDAPLGSSISPALMSKVEQAIKIHLDIL